MKRILGRGPVHRRRGGRVRSRQRRRQPLGGPRRRVAVAPAAPSPRGVAEPGRTARDRPPRPRLDAEHQPHGLLRRRGQRLVRPGRRRPPDPALRQHDARGTDRGRPGRVRDQLPGRADVRRGRRCAGRLGHGDPPAHGPGDRGPRVVRHHPAQATSTAASTPASATRTRSRRSRASSRPTAARGRSRPSRSTPPPTTRSTPSAPIS